VAAQLEDGCGQPLTEDVFRDATLACELQQVQHLAHLVVVVGEGDGPCELRRGQAAHGAFGDAHGRSKAGRFHPQRVAAARAG
jgi:hypothetical protein